MATGEAFSPGGTPQGPAVVKDHRMLGRAIAAAQCAARVTLSDKSVDMLAELAAYEYRNGHYDAGARVIDTAFREFRHLQPGWKLRDESSVPHELLLKVGLVGTAYDPHRTLPMERVTVAEATLRAARDSDAAMDERYGASESSAEYEAVIADFVHGRLSGSIPENLSLYGYLNARSGLPIYPSDQMDRPAFVEVTKTADSIGIF